MSLATLEHLYRDHHGWLLGWLRRRMGGADHAADVAHDAYLRLLQGERMPHFDDARRYLTQIAKHLLIDQYRRQRVEAAYLETVRHLPEPQMPDAESRYLIIEALVAIDAMLQNLPGRVREALLLRQLEGLSYQQIALRLNVSVSSVEKYVARGLLACWQVMEP